MGLVGGLIEIGVDRCNARDHPLALHEWNGRQFAPDTVNISEIESESAETVALCSNILCAYLSFNYVGESRKP